MAKPWHVWYLLKAEGTTYHILLWMKLHSFPRRHKEPLFISNLSHPQSSRENSEFRHHFWKHCNAALWRVLARRDLGLRKVNQKTPAPQTISFHRTPRREKHKHRTPWVWDHSNTASWDFIYHMTALKKHQHRNTANPHVPLLKVVVTEFSHPHTLKRNVVWALPVIIYRKGCYIIHLLYGPEGNSFFFPRESWCFPRRSRGKH